MALAGKLTNIQRYSTKDGPGIRTTAFLKGCPLHCAWCHNPECIGAEDDVYFWDAKCVGCGKCIEACPTGAQKVPNADGSGKIDRSLCVRCGKCAQVCRIGALTLVGFDMTTEQAADALYRDHIFYDTSGGGVTISGGEPLAQPSFTLEVLKQCKEKKLHTCIDTTLYASWEVIESLIPYLDLALVDLKHMDSAWHKELTGVPNERILENLEKLAKQVHIRIRIPLIPDFNANEDNLRTAAEFVGRLDPEHIDAVDLLTFHNWAEQKYRKLDQVYAYAEVPDMEEAVAQSFRPLFEQQGVKVTING
ncbi:MAG: glycyl-radical enzyme activating protein [Lachnospiraceae bacterium]|nr:glycyl-radical enzyme activating protein [Lachnospiraceae bacterium]